MAYHGLYCLRCKYFMAFMEKTLEKSLMSNGIWTGNRLIYWSTVRSYKWKGKKEGYFTLKIEYYEYYTYHTAILRVIDKQKEEVDGLFKKMVRVSKTN
ncbi:hypothetical protein Desaci_1418 [Desulfosporosinus acidiphilus SJ4]|uniref:Uncharacterized protein n=1 Tax=Desulfosporosinus acidiphilus (strain DSM 22704 / JCM 16185 / SJ4) TaxID=646529 RepID=I4D3R3_DESAJ|nr:hypothetical protein Desaci_1418 [Desulfosporosinus acidiphilus SJ4]